MSATQCPKCGGIAPLAALPPLDAEPSTLPPQPLLEVTVEHAVSFPQSLSTVTLAASPNSPSIVEFPFLSPAQHPDELGRLGAYRVLGVLGSGGMGVVFRGEDPVLRRSVALKVMLPQFGVNPLAKARFLREARAQAAVEHDNIIAIYQVGEERGVAFITMPLLKGLSLAESLKEHPLPLISETIRIVREIALGLRAAHAQNLVHRDIKPANVWLEGVDRRVKILDFGLARTETDGAETVTQEGAIIGTPSYMSPEQACGEPVDCRTDLFSLGVVLYQMLTGQLPFTGKNTHTVLVSVTTSTPQRPAELNPQVGRALDSLTMRLLAKSPADRPASAVDVVEELSTPEADTGLTALLRPVTLKRPVPPSGDPTTTSSPNRRWPHLVRVVIGLGVLIAVGFGLYIGSRPSTSSSEPRPTPEPIPIGVLHSQTGTMATSEGPLIDATALAVDEINAAGGVLGRPVRSVIADGMSDPRGFQTAAEHLISSERVPVIFGCQTSPSRKAVQNVVERDNCLLFFPASFEGLELSPRIIYTGTAPNQKVLPAIEYVVKSLSRKRLFVLGSNYVSPRSISELIRDHMKLATPDCEIVGMYFVPLGATDMSAALDTLVAAKPDVIVNILNGSSNFPFYRELRNRGIDSAKVPTLSISLSEHDLVGLDPKLVAGDYLSANYFQSVDREENRLFLAKVKAKFGDQRVVTDNMIASYTGVHLWAMAATKAGSPDPSDVVKAIGGIEYEGPGGMIRIDPDNHYAWRPWRVGQIQTDGSVKIVAAATTSVRGDPFPATRSRRDWDRLLTELYVEWGGKWQAPSK